MPANPPDPSRVSALDELVNEVCRRVYKLGLFSLAKMQGRPSSNKHTFQAPVAVYRFSFGKILSRVIAKNTSEGG